MRLSWRIGRIAGIDVFVHATFLLVFLFLPEVFQGGAKAVATVLLILAIFGCVLLHELGHALAARRFGIETEDITLYPIGGVARLRRMPRAPGAELVIALAGPAVNFAIAAAIYTLTPLWAVTSGWVGFVGPFLNELGLINLLLGLFNLLPAFPMDGGRVLRALLSGWLGRVPATQIAATVGRGLAVCLGILLFWAYRNPMHLVLAAFIYFAASAEETQVLRDERRRLAGSPDAGIWVAPPGYRWVRRGDGIWQLAPHGVSFPHAHPDATPWR
jgi:Zn-dependent protease